MLVASQLPDQRSWCALESNQHLHERLHLTPHSDESLSDFMNGNEFVKRIKRLGKERNIAVRFKPRKGKGSHGRSHYGDHFTTVKDRRKEIGPSLLAAMIRQLGISQENFSRKRSKS